MERPEFLTDLGLRSGGGVSREDAPGDGQADSRDRTPQICGGLRLVAELQELLRGVQRNGASGGRIAGADRLKELQTTSEL